ncbi:hypothetical protein FOZ62_030772 [Perkinsus olseni]|uniref:Uncharacterized protein n=1 Tax=Perkinsus olseni TaxID=32597 RepID=A0A7J6U8Z3_PEROL|nr:hypothetical protein FOZ62_030772 [Perkinsus olseni]
MPKDKDDAGGEDKAIIATLQTTMTLPLGEGSSDPTASTIPCFTVLLYRSNDPFNREFHAPQARWLGELLGVRWLQKQEKGVLLVVHHDTMGFPPSLEIGDSRLISDVFSLSVRKWSPRLSPRVKEADLSSSIKNPSRYVMVDGLDFRVVKGSGGEGACRWSKDLVIEDGEIATGPRIGGVLPSGQLVLSMPFISDPASPRAKAAFLEVVEHAMASTGKRKALVLIDGKDPFLSFAHEKFQNLDDSSLLSTAPTLARQEVALTALPKNLTDDEQKALFVNPLAVAEEMLPWHTGKLVVGGGSS